MDELILIGKRIAEIRCKRGLTQEKLAEIINYSANHIAKLESARTNPSFDLLVNFSKSISVSPFLHTYNIGNPRDKNQEFINLF